VLQMRDRTVVVRLTEREQEILGILARGTVWRVGNG